MSRLGKVIRGLVGLVVVAGLLFTVNLWYRDYRVASHVKPKRTTASTSTVDPGTVVAIRGETASILVDGLALRSGPATTSVGVRTLKKGEQLPLVGITASNWLQLKDKGGKLGYLANDSHSIKVEK